MGLEAKKTSIIKMISCIDDEKILDEVGRNIINLVPNSSSSTEGKYFVKTIEEHLDINELAAERGFSGVDKYGFMKLANDLNIDESLEELIEMID